MVILHANDIYPTNADGTMPFKQNSDLFYLTGVDQEETTLLLMPDAVDPKEREILFVKETSEHIAIWEGEKLTKEQARAATGIERIEWSHAFDGFLHRLVPQVEHLEFLLVLGDAQAVQQGREPLVAVERITGLAIFDEASIASFHHHAGT